MRIFRITDFLECAINHESQRTFQLIISEILGHHNQGIFTQIFPIGLFVKAAYYVVKILHK